jgi:hypothetical protein
MSPAEIELAITNIRLRAKLPLGKQKQVAKPKAQTSQPTRQQRILIKAGVPKHVAAFAIGQLSPQTLKAFELFSRSR